MKIRTVLVLLTAAFLALPAYACGPGMSNGTTSTSNGGRQMSPGRERWTRKRLGHLKRQRQQLNQPRGYDEVDMYSHLQQMNDPFAITASDKRRDAERRQREMNVIETLAIKKERGELTPKGEKKLQDLLRKYQHTN